MLRPLMLPHYATEIQLNEHAYLWLGVQQILSQVSMKFRFYCMADGRAR